MPESTYSWKVGEIECVAISDGSSPYPPQLFFASIPPDVERIGSSARTRTWNPSVNSRMLYH